MIRLNKAEKAKLARFGCALRPADGKFYIDWPQDGLRDVRRASVLIRGIHYKSEMGEIFCLGIEVSPIRFVPRYCYYPFDLTDHSHRRVLDELIEKGLLKCHFRSGPKTIERNIRIPGSQLSLIATLYRQALADLEVSKDKNTDFKKALAELEETDFLPSYFARCFSENELPLFQKTIKQEADKIPPEKRGLSQKIIQGVFDVAKDRYPKDIRFLLDNLKWWIWFLHIVSDLYREYRDDYRGMVQFIADLAAINATDKELEEMAWFPQALNSLCELIEQLRSESDIEQQAILPRVVSLFATVRSRLSSGQGLSQDFLKRSIAVLGPQVRGKPGRRPGDYSGEYALRKRGLSWQELAKQRYESDPDLQSEFGVSTFDELEFEDSYNLTRRIMQRVKSYERRLQKSTPS